MKAFRGSRRQWAIVVAIVGGLAVGASAVQAGTIYVSTSGNNANNGLSWATAKRDILAAANITFSGDQIWVARGTYVENVTLPGHVAMYGGFAGTESSLVERDWVANPTIIDGNQAGSVITITPIASSLARVDGFSLRNGKAEHGGGINFHGVSPTIVNNIVTGNTAANSGGGIYFYDASPTIASNTFQANSSVARGGAIYAANSILSIVNNTFQANSTFESGGAIFAGSCQGTVLNNTVANNTASYGSGINCAYCSSLTVADNVIADNVASGGSGSSGYGGGLYCSSSSVTITRNTIARNIVQGNDGGGIYCDPCDTTIITENMITDNRASRGGGLYCNLYADYGQPPPVVTIGNNSISGNTATQFGGGICCAYGFATIDQNTITNNRATWDGGGIYCYGSTGTITSNMIAANMAEGGAGIYCAYYSTVVIMSNSIAGNAATYPGGGLYCGSDTSPAVIGNTIICNRAASGGGIHCSSFTTVVNTIIAFNSSGLRLYGASSLAAFRHNCVYANNDYDYLGLADPNGTDGNISADPLFVAANPGADGLWGTADDTYDDLHLLESSPCRNAGDPAFAPTGGETDIDGQSRVMAGRVDIGADEFTWDGDANQDGYVDVVDLLSLVYSFGTAAGEPGYDPTCDFNQDGLIDVADLLDLAYNFGK